MDLESILEEYSLTDFAVGAGGCQNQSPLECCEHDITVFDGRVEGELVVEQDGNFVRVHHGSLNEYHSNILAQLCDLQILRDDRWEIRMLLSTLRERRGDLFRDSARNSLLDLLFCTARARHGLAAGDMLAPAWLKCAAFYLADAICFSNGIRPSPAHMLGALRKLDRDPISEKLAVVHSCIGIDRATPVLLERMSKSTMGLSDMVEGNGHSGIIGRKHDYMAGHQQIPDCYFYLGYTSRNIMVAAKDMMPSRPELAHVLRIALDLDGDTERALGQCRILRGAANEILASAT